MDMEIWKRKTDFGGMLSAPSTRERKEDGSARSLRELLAAAYGEASIKVRQFLPIRFLSKWTVGKEWFWKDRWCTSETLCIMFLNLFALDRNKGVVKDFIIGPRSFCSWNLQFRRNLNYWEVEDASQLMHLLDTTALGDREEEDLMIWNRIKDGKFSMQSCFQSLSSWDLNFFPAKCIWNPIIPSKVCFFSWKAVLGRIPAVDLLISHGMITPNRCIMCGTEAESQPPSHPLSDCFFPSEFHAAQAWHLLSFPLHVWCHVVVGAKGLKWAQPERKDHLDLYPFC